MKRGLTAILVSHNSNDYLPVCLSSIYKSLNSLSIQVIVVDNASTEKPSTLYKSEFSEVLWLDSKENLGFGKACNLGVRAAEFENLFFINPDTYISDNTFEQMLDFVESEKDLGIVGPKILNGDGSLQAACRRNFPTPLGALYHTLGIDKLFPSSSTFGQYNMTYRSENEIHELDAVSGSFFWISKKIYKEINGFDEDFFLYGEDLDLCYRVKALGLKNVYFPNAKVMHFKGHSSNQKPWRTSFHFYNAMRIFAQKHSELTQLPYFLVELGIFFSAFVGSFFRIINSPKKLAIDIMALFLLVIASVGSNLFDPFDSAKWLLPSLLIFFIASIMSNRYKNLSEWESIPLLSKKELLAIGIACTYTYINTQSIKSLFMILCLAILRVFFELNRKSFLYFVKKSHRILSIGELNKEEMKNLLAQSHFDWCGKIEIDEKKASIDPFCLGTSKDLANFQKRLSITHLVLQPRTFNPAQKVLFCEELELNTRINYLLFPSLGGSSFVEINLRILR